MGLEAHYTVRMGDSFELSVPEESGAEDYFWSLPEMLNVIEGENTSRLLVAGLVEGVIPAGASSPSRPAMLREPVRPALCGKRLR